MLRAQLERRGVLLAHLRSFMAARDILEVDTPLLRPWPAPDAHVYPLPAGAGDWLQASPEAAMKALLAAGSGPIYQLGHVFRADERGRLHVPEFTLLEWYRPGFNERMLMLELSTLLVELGLTEPLYVDYENAFAGGCGLDPHTVSYGRLQEHACSLGLVNPTADRGALLDFIFAVEIMPALGHGAPTLLVNFPACQAGLAVIDKGYPPVAKRFELVINGVEIANGCQELVVLSELRTRLAGIYEAHAAHHRCAVALDQELLAAAEIGIPACAGVALGVDRLCMVLENATHVDAVLCRPPGMAAEQATRPLRRRAQGTTQIPAATEIVR